MTAREDKEKEKTSRETLGKFFYDLAKTCFTAIVVGNVISMFSNDGNGFYSVMLFLIGIVATMLFARIGYVIIKK